MVKESQPTPADMRAATRYVVVTISHCECSSPSCRENSITEVAGLFYTRNGAESHIKRKPCKTNEMQTIVSFVEMRSLRRAIRMRVWRARRAQRLRAMRHGRRRQ